MRILYISGGSAGHLAPLVSVERAMEKLRPEAQHLFLCTTKKEDAEYLTKEGIRFSAATWPRRSIFFPLQFVRSFFQSRAIIEHFKPDVIFSKGGSVSIPACFAAQRLKIPIVIHESDAVMGKANAIVAGWATNVCLGFRLASLQVSSSAAEPETCQPANFPRFIVTGNPIRPSITKGSKSEGFRITGFTGDRPVLLVMGGSQGAQALNEAVIAHIDTLLKTCDIIHLTGKGKKGATPRAGYWCKEFAFEELPHLYDIATLALSRAGAGSISELAANGIPSILVPIRGLANDHQYANAIAAQENGKCIILLQEELKEKLPVLISEFAADTARLAAISKSIKSLYHPDASLHIAQIIAGCVATRKETH